MKIRKAKQPTTRELFEIFRLKESEFLPHAALTCFHCCGRSCLTTLLATVDPAPLKLRVRGKPPPLVLFCPALWSKVSSWAHRPGAEVGQQFEPRARPHGPIGKVPILEEPRVRTQESSDPEVGHFGSSPSRPLCWLEFWLCGARGLRNEVTQGQFKSTRLQAEMALTFVGSWVGN